MHETLILTLLIIQLGILTGILIVGYGYLSKLHREKEQQTKAVEKYYKTAKRTQEAVESVDIAAALQENPDVQPLSPLQMLDNPVLQDEQSMNNIFAQVLAGDDYLTNLVASKIGIPAMVAKPILVTVMTTIAKLIGSGHMKKDDPPKSGDFPQFI